MRLADYAIAYLAERPGLSRDYRRMLMGAVGRFCAWSGRSLEVADVDQALLSGWATRLLTDSKPVTVNGKLALIRRLLLAAYDDGILDRPPRRMRRLPEFAPPPEAWTIDQCRLLFAYLGDLSGRVGTAPACDWWTSLVLTCYWTGCRIGALLKVSVEDYVPGQGLTVRNQKNGRQQWYPLPESCCEAIERVLPQSGLVWSWPKNPRTLWLQFRRFVEEAGLPAPRTHCQLFHRLRRTNASYCAAEDPAIAQRQLDHARMETTRQRYIDPRIAKQRSAADVLPDPLPPKRKKPRLRVIG